MGVFRKLRRVLCCYGSKHLIDVDDDDATVVDEDSEHQQALLADDHEREREESPSEKPTTITDTSLYDDYRPQTPTSPHPSQVGVKSVLRRRRSSIPLESAEAHTPRRRYNILLFGDSLTAGWCTKDGFAESHPYGLKIQKRFEEKGLDVEVTVNGVSECCVNMEERLKGLLEQPNKWYDWVVILGGTNDVFNGYTAWEIFDALKKLYSLSSKHGARVLGITIPEFDKDIVNHLDYQRRIVNEHLNVHNNNTTRNTFALFLLDKFLPLHSMTEAQREIFWEVDGIHPSADGYDLMGDMIFDVIFREGTWD